MKTTPHVRLTVEDLKQQYLTGKLTVRGYLYNWLLATRKRGWKLRTTVKDFCTELGISRSAFYKAVAELRAEPGSDFRFEVHGEIEMWIEESTTNEPVHDHEHVSSTVDTMSTIVDTMSMTVDAASTSVENKTLEPASSKDPRPLSSSYNSYTTLPQAVEESSKKNEQPAAMGIPPMATETMGRSNTDSIGMNGNSGSFTSIAQFLAETKRKLQEQVEWQRSQRMQRLTGVSHVGTQGSSLIPDPSDRTMTTT
jgi:hypothetical protein